MWHFDVDETLSDVEGVRKVCVCFEESLIRL